MVKICFKYCRIGIGFEWVTQHKIV